MAIQHTLDALMSELTQEEAAELIALIETWPNHDDEIRCLVEENFYELLDAIKNNASESQTETQQSGIKQEEAVERECYPPSSPLTGPLFPTAGSFLKPS